MQNMRSYFVAIGTFVAAMNFAISRAEASEPTVSAAIQPLAEQHLKAGIKALKTKRWDKARDEFLLAWQIDKHYRIAANLGLVEIELRQYREAAEHLQYCLLSPTDMSDEHREALQELFNKARAQIGVIEVRTAETGATILLDGEVIGQAPISSIFVEPGRRTFTARMAGKSFEDKPVEIAAGQTLEVLIAEQPPELPPPPRKESRTLDWKMVAVPTGALISAAGFGMGIGFAGSLNPQISPEVRKERSTAAIIGFSVGGAALVTTVIMAFWPKEVPKKTGFFIAPIVAGDQRGVHVGGAF